ncbi:hypothetical protein ACOSQ2_000044 [Xanthoceras sorbifolium]
MGSIGNPKAWVPYVNSKDCSQGFCSLYCPQWCYIIFPPPPPVEFPDDSSSTNFSPLVIGIIGILASAFLLVSYYSIISKYCGNTNSSRRRENDDPIEELVRDNNNAFLHEPWHAAATGLDEALIKSITMCKFKKGDGLIEGIDCSVCLSEFEEDESIRLLPKCSHAFHVQCIDTWLKSHSNCPLCRANIFFISASPPQLPPVMAETPPNHGSLQDHSQGASENIAAAQDRERDVSEEEIIHNDGIPKTPVRAFSDLGNLQGRDIVIEIREEAYQEIRRSVSMDHSCQRSRVSIAEVLRTNQDDDMIEKEEFSCDHAGSSKQSSAEFGKSSHRKNVLHCVMNPVSMKRSLF